MGTSKLIKSALFAFLTLTISSQASAADNVYCSNIDFPDNGFYIAVLDGYGAEAAKIVGTNFNCSYVGKTDNEPTTVEAMVSETGVPYREVEQRIQDMGITKETPGEYAGLLQSGI